MRRFEYVQGSSKKFWSVGVQGDLLTTRWGRIGSNGQTKTKSFADHAAASKEAEKLIKQKTKKGYKEVAEEEDIAMEDLVVAEPPKRTHRSALGEAFKAIRKTGAIALANRGITVSAGWEDLNEACDKKGLTERNGLFWTHQANDAFGDGGRLLDGLYLQWVGDVAAFCEALRAAGLDVVEPPDEDTTIIVRPTPLEGEEVEQAATLDGPLLDAVLDDPTNDEAVVAFGDSLLANGDERGEWALLHHEYGTKGKLAKKKARRLHNLHRMYAQDFCPPNACTGNTNYCYVPDPFDEYMAYDSLYLTAFRNGFLFRTAAPYEDAEWDPETEKWETLAPAPPAHFDHKLWRTVRQLQVHTQEQLEEVIAAGLGENLTHLKAPAAALAQVDAKALDTLEQLDIAGACDEWEWISAWQVPAIHVSDSQLTAVVEAASTNKWVQTVASTDRQFGRTDEAALVELN